MNKKLIFDSVGEEGKEKDAYDIPHRMVFAWVNEAVDDKGRARFEAFTEGVCIWEVN